MREQRIALVTVFIIFFGGITSVFAGIAWSGDVNPTNPATWTESTTGYIGYTNNGTMDITYGDEVLCESGYVGLGSSSEGNVTVDGIGSEWSNGYLTIGCYGSGILNVIQDGAIYNSYPGLIGKYSGSTGKVIVKQRGYWKSWSCLYVEYYGKGRIEITEGGNVETYQFFIGRFSNDENVTLVSGNNSKLTSDAYIVVEYEGTGTLNISDSGTVCNNGTTAIGLYAGSHGTVTVDGYGSKWTNNNDESFGIAIYGSGSLNINNGGVVSNNDGHIGYYAGATGEVTVNGIGSTWTNSTSLYIGYEGSGVLNINEGGLVVADSLTIDYNNDNDSFIHMSEGGMLALKGNADNSLAEFLARIPGSDAIYYWEVSISSWVV